MVARLFCPKLLARFLQKSTRNRPSVALISFARLHLT
jgi:hypothetical protein